MVVHETRMTANAVRFGNGLHVARHETDKAVALAPHALHDLASVDADNAVGMDAEARRLCDGMGGLGGGNEQLARHAAHARAGGAIVAAFDHHGARSRGFGCAVRRKSRRAGADNRNVNLQGFHVSASVHRQFTITEVLTDW